MSLTEPRTTTISTQCPLCTGELTVALHTGTSTAVKRGGQWEVNLYAHTNWGPHACLPLPHNGLTVPYHVTWTTFVAAAQRVAELGGNWDPHSMPALESAEMLRAVSRAAGFLLNADNPPEFGPVAHAADDLMIGLDQGRSAAQMWADFIDACALLVAAERGRGWGGGW